MRVWCVCGVRVCVCGIILAFTQEATAMQGKIREMKEIIVKFEEVCHMRVAALHCDIVLADIRGPQEVKENRVICREVHAAFGKTVDRQCDQPFNVAHAFDLVKTESQKIVADALAKLSTDVTSTLEVLIEGKKNKICAVLQEHLDFSKRQGAYLYTCKRLSAALYSDISRTHSQFAKTCARERS